MIDLKKRPFGLKDKEEVWVRQTLVSMTIEEKVGQLLCPQLSIFDDNLIRHLTEDLHVGAVMIRPFEEEGLRENIEKIQKMSKIPLLVSANLENGANGAIYEERSLPILWAVQPHRIHGSAYRLGRYPVPSLPIWASTGALHPLLTSTRITTIPSPMCVPLARTRIRC